MKFSKKTIKHIEMAMAHHGWYLENLNTPGGFEGSQIHKRERDAALNAIGLKYVSCPVAGWRIETI